MADSNKATEKVDEIWVEARAKGNIASGIKEWRKKHPNATIQHFACSIEGRGPCEAVCIILYTEDKEGE